VPRDENFKCIRVAVLNSGNGLGVWIKGNFPVDRTGFCDEKIRDFPWGCGDRDPGLEIRYGADAELDRIQEIGKRSDDDSLQNLLFGISVRPKPGPVIDGDCGGFDG
jgi:hypothetical protein